MDSKLAFVLLLAAPLLLFGCLESQGPLSEEELMAKFSCDYGATELESQGEITVYECLRESEKGAEAVYEIDAHPMGVWAATYLVFDGSNYAEVTDADDLTPYFAPIESAEEALKFAYLHEGLSMVQKVNSAPSAGETTAAESGAGYEVSILHADRSMCPCYGAYWRSDFQVGKDGSLTKLGSEEVYSYSDPDCMC